MNIAARCLLLCWITLSTAVFAAAPVLIVDGDGDGISDEVDDCPYTPPGIRVDATGCPKNKADGDLDGVPDVVDDCPYTPAGAEVNFKGCAIDDDFDGVANGLDRCPRTRLGLTVDEMGCASGEQPVKALRPQSKPEIVRMPTVSVVAQPVTPQKMPPAQPAAAPQLSAPAAVAAPVVAASPAASDAEESEKPRLQIRFSNGSARLGAGDLLAIEGYAKVFSRALARNPRAVLVVKAYSDRSERDVATLAVQRMTLLRKALVEQGIAMDRVRSGNGVLTDGTPAQNRRAEAEVAVP